MSEPGGVASRSGGRGSDAAVVRSRVVAGGREEHALTALQTILLGSVVVGVFGPYVVGGIRTEQALMYLVGLSSLLLSRVRWIVPQYLAPWLIILTMATFSQALAGGSVVGWPRGDMLSGIDNYMAPVMVMLALGGTVRADQGLAALRLSAKIIAVAMAANAVIAIVATQVDLTAVLARFWSADPSASTALNAAQMGRYSGVFNQPAEAGVAYSLALLLCVYLLRVWPWPLFAIIALIVVGGVLTVSKIFLFVGLPIAVVYLVVSLPRQGRLASLGIVIFATTLLVVTATRLSVADSWSGLSYFTRLLSAPTSTSAIDFYTAGRWSSDSKLINVISYVLGVSPFGGLGFSGLSVAYDSAWTEIVIVSGLLGAVCLAFVMGATLVVPQGRAGSSVRQLGVCVGVLVIGGSLGLPVLTANRAGSLTWLLMLLIALASRGCSLDDGIGDGGVGRGQIVGGWARGRLGPTEAGDARSVIVGVKGGEFVGPTGATEDGERRGRRAARPTGR